MRRECAAPTQRRSLLARSLHPMSTSRIRNGRRSEEQASPRGRGQRPWHPSTPQARNPEEQQASGPGEGAGAPHRRERQRRGRGTGAAGVGCAPGGRGSGSRSSVLRSSAAAATEHPSDAHRLGEVSWGAMACGTDASLSRAPPIPREGSMQHGLAPLEKHRSEPARQCEPPQAAAHTLNSNPSSSQQSRCRQSPASACPNTAM